MLLVLLISGAEAADGSETLAVDVAAGGLGRAATILSSRHGVSVSFEAVPRVVEGVSYERKRDPRGEWSTLPISHTVRFEYPATATPREAAEAAVAAWNATPSREAHYRVDESDGVLHFVPYEVLTTDGAYVPHVSLLDAELVLDRSVGPPTKLWKELVAKLAETTGTPVRNSSEGILLGTLDVPIDDPLYWRQVQRDVTIPGRGSARTLLDALLQTTEEQTTWLLLWTFPNEPGDALWSLSYATAKPEDEATLNRTPILPVQPVPP